MMPRRWRPLPRISLDILHILPAAELAEHLPGHDLGKADDGVQRRAQLVAHIGEEAALGAACRLGMLLRLLEAPLALLHRGEVADDEEEAAIGAGLRLARTQRPSASLTSPRSSSVQRSAKAAAKSAPGTSCGATSGKNAPAWHWRRRCARRHRRGPCPRARRSRRGPARPRLWRYRAMVSFPARPSRECPPPSLTPAKFLAKWRIAGLRRCARVGWEVGGGQVPRQPGQVRKEAAVTSFGLGRCPVSHLFPHPEASRAQP